jgi:hypothetical protein
VSGSWPRRKVLTSALLATPLGAALTACSGSKAAWTPAGGSVAPDAPATNASGAPVNAAPQPATPADSPKPHYVPGKCILGSYLDLKGQTQAQSLALRRQQLGRDLGILQIYWNWDGALPRKSPAPDGTTLMISWYGTNYASILNGSQDTIIARAADTLAAMKQPIFLRWAWEMNGNWYPWDGTHNANTPSGYIQAWRYLHAIFNQHKADNVAWVWAPNVYNNPTQAWNDMDNYYPGDDYVDWIGVDGYPSGRNTPADVFQKFTDRYKVRKPVMIAETGIEDHGGTVKADWINQLHDWLIANPAVGAMLWFDTDDDRSNPQNWRIDTSPSALAAFKNMVDDPRFR